MQTGKHRGHAGSDASVPQFVLTEPAPIWRLPSIEDAPRPTACAAADVLVVFSRDAQVAAQCRLRSSSPVSLLSSTRLRCPMPVEHCTLMLAYDGFRFFVVEAGALFNGFSWATSALFGLSHKRFLLWQFSPRRARRRPSRSVQEDLIR